MELGILVIDSTVLVMPVVKPAKQRSPFHLLIGLFLFLLLFLWNFSSSEEEEEAEEDVESPLWMACRLLRAEKHISLFVSFTGIRAKSQSHARND